MRRREPLTELERRRLAKRRELAELVVSSLPDDPDEWIRVVGERFGRSASRSAAIHYPNREALLAVLSDEWLTFGFYILDAARAEA